MLNRFSFSNVSVRKGLLLLIFFLLLCVIVTFGYTSYWKIKNAELQSGEDRLHSLTAEITTTFSALATAITTTTHETANLPALKKYLVSNGKDSAIAAQNVLNHVQVDPLFPLVELFDANKQLVLSSGNKEISNVGSHDSLLFANAAPGEVGILHLLDSSLYFPIVVSVIDTNHIAGYLVRWRKLVTTPQQIEDFSHLIGSEGALYIGNDDGKLWTDGIVSIPVPPVDQKDIQKTISYVDPRGYTVLASASKVPGARWEILVALSQKIVTETATRFLYWMMGIGIALLSIGILLALVLSRSIITPLETLTAATDAIAGGNFNLQVEVKGKNELARLAKAFNTMTVHVRDAQYNLEKKVLDRTSELESANKELEAFTYSVSHDLRSPLRVINGYATIITEEYDEVLPKECKRLTGIIMHNATYMGALIDDLLKLSHLGKTTLNVQQVNMNTLVSSIVDEQQSSLVNLTTEIKVNDLQAANCDQNLIRQVWVNLISNAIKYSSKKEKGLIEIGTYNNVNEVVYFVKDNGAGFDMQFADKLFGVFQRLHSSTEFEGTGIGLAIAHRIVTKHSGSMWARSEVNNGATFYFSLPG